VLTGCCPLRLEADLVCCWTHMGSNNPPGKGSDVRSERFIASRPRESDNTGQYCRVDLGEQEGRLAAVVG